MDVVATSLEALIQRIFNVQSQELDTAATEAFCTIVNKEVDGVPLASKLLSLWIQSAIESQALQALTLLDTCMQRCGPLFISEIGKFRFLNEMIKLVSPKYLGNKTPKSVREKVLYLLQKWTNDFPRETKIREAYDMLKKQGVVKDDRCSYVNNTETLNYLINRRNPILHNEETSKLLQKLLKSKNPDDLHAANRLIKTMVREDEKRVQKELRRDMDLESIHNNVKLLSDMLDLYTPTESKKEDTELIKDLYEGCERLQPTLERLAQETQNNEEMLLDIVRASEELEEVRNKYIHKLLKINHSPLLNDIKTEETLLDLNGYDTATSKSNDTLHSKENDQSVNCQSDIDLLKDIFDFPNNSNTSLNLLHEQSIFSSAQVMQPINVKNPMITGSNDAVPRLINKFEEVIINSDLKVQKLTISSNDNMSTVPFDNLLKKSDIHNYTGGNFLSGNECKVISSSTSKISENTFSNIESSNLKQMNKFDIKHDDNEFAVESLANISVKLEDITPDQKPPITVIDDCNGITVQLHFAKDIPRFDVSVLVITTMNKSSKPINNYLFQAVVPKNCKCKMQLPSTTKLPAHNPFLPPSAISQIMLIANPHKEELSLKFMLSYCIDSETITEMGEVKQLFIK